MYFYLKRFSSSAQHKYVSCSYGGQSLNCVHLSSALRYRLQTKHLPENQRISSPVWSWHPPSLLFSGIKLFHLFFTLLSAEHVPARFGNEDSHSYAAFIVNGDLGHNLSISLFLRTRRRDGFILALANSSSHYMHLWLEDGKVTVQLHNFESLKAKSAIDDGEVHFVSLEMVKNRVTLYVAAQKQGDMEIETVSVQAGDTVYVGGLLGSRTTLVYGGYFKGCIQDLRINDRRLQFFGLDTSVSSYPREVMENVIAGCSGDNVCSVSKSLVWTVYFNESC